jgi:hypothetical protein
VPEHRVKRQATMGLIPMQIEGNPEEHQLDRGERHDKVTPEGQLKETVGGNGAHQAVLLQPFVTIDCLPKIT